MLSIDSKGLLVAGSFIFTTQNDSEDTRKSGVESAFPETGKVMDRSIVYVAD